MAINTKKISALTELNDLSGDEYLMVAKNNRSYKAKSSLFTSDRIKSITQTNKEGDGVENTITITTSDGSKYDFIVRNGYKGSTGDTGKTGAKGETGNSGIVLYHTDTVDNIYNRLDGLDENEAIVPDDELATMILSALQGNILNGKLKELEEEYITQEDYDARVENGQIFDNVKYFIVEEEEA